MRKRCLYCDGKLDIVSAEPNWHPTIEGMIVNVEGVVHCPECDVEFVFDLKEGELEERPF